MQILDSPIQKLYKNGFNLDPLSSGPQAYITTYMLDPARRKQAAQIQNFRKRELQQTTLTVQCSVFRDGGRLGGEGEAIPLVGLQLPIVLDSNSAARRAPATVTPPLLSASSLWS